MHFTKRASKVPQPERDVTVTVTLLEQTSRPPSYCAAPDLDLTAAFSSLDLTPAPDAELPSADTCLAHLKLLHAFHALRQSVENHDGIFKIRDAFNPHAPGSAEFEQIASAIRQKRWGVYVTKAVQRFHKWWAVAVMPMAQKLKAEEMPKVLTRFVYDGTSMRFDVQDLPPLDVLLVWHAYHLNPRAYLEDSLRHGKADFWRAGFPWAAVNASVDNNDFTYTGTRYAMASWVQRTHMPWNALDDCEDATISCPACKRDMSLPWTGYTRGGEMWKSTDKLQEELSQGVADKSMNFNCPFCQSDINHEELRLEKFWNDFVALAEEGVAMPSTILRIDGIPDPVTRRKETSFPNRLLLANTELPARLRKATRPGTGQTVAHIRAEIESLLTDSLLLYQARDVVGSKLTRDERVSIRRMMAAYWNSSSPYFSLDLVGAVIRQGSFIEKMVGFDWLHSPSARFTMSKLLTKYERYIAIIAEHKTRVAVPTLDVDLAWHTHQLDPAQYYKYVEWQTNQFIDHDDKIDETALSDAFEWTTKTYQKKYHEVYSECVCWYCECVREASSSSHSSHLKSAFGMKKGGDAHIEAQLANLHRNGNEDGAHVSAHSVIRALTDNRAKLDEKHKQHLDHLYEKLSKRAMKAGRKAPVRAHTRRENEDSEDQRTNGAAGIWPIYVAPYQGNPDVDAGHYANNPACASFVSGAQGNCCQGACGGSVAAGACAGASCGGGGGGCGGGGGGCGGGGGF